MEDSKMKKALTTFAVVFFIVFLVLAIYYGVVNAKELVVDTSGWSAKTVEKFNFGLFLIHFLKYIALGMLGGGVLMFLASKTSDY